MANTVLMASDNTRNLTLSEETRQRKKSRSIDELKKKKQPQRGMGVAQLERLRLQEKWKKLTEINPLQSLNLHHPDFLPSSLACSKPASCANPVQFAKCSTYGGLNGVGQLGLNRALLLQMFGNGGFHGLCDSSGVNSVFTAHFLVDSFGMGALSPDFRVENAIETSEELSSMPSRGCYSIDCGACHKENHMNGETFGCSGMRNMYTELSPINGEAVLNRVGYAGHHVDQEAEVVAIHRKQSPGGGSVFMEYEFFPGKGGKSTSPKEDLKVGSEAWGGTDAFCLTTKTTGVDSIDLSLKL